MVNHLYHYRALDGAGRIVAGATWAANLDDVEHRLNGRRLELLRARRNKRQGAAPATRREQIDFCFHLEHLLTAGITLHDALRDMEDGTQRPAFRATLAYLVDAVGNGMPLSDALSSLPSGFDPVLSSLVAAGECSGRLPEVLHQAGESLQRLEELRSGTARLLLYPALAATAAIGATFFLMLFLVPQMRSFLLDSGHPLPLQTRLLFEFSAFMENNWPALALLPIALTAGYRLLGRHPAWQRKADGWRLQLPIIGPIQLKTGIARLAELLALLYASGVPLLQAVDTVRQAAGNRMLEEALGKARQQIEQGHPLAAAFSGQPLFPPLLVRMMQVGERTGRLDTVLHQLARRYQREAAEASSRLQTLIEPALTLAIGLLLGWVMLAILQPIYDIAGRLR